MADMTNPAVIRLYADKHRFFAKKNLGQNFLAMQTSQKKSPTRPAYRKRTMCSKSVRVSAH
jgi:hypothetical protein